MDVSAAIAKRRSIRKFEAGREVSDADLVSIVEAARQAPSWKNDQPWRFVVVRDAGLRERMAGCLGEGNPAANAVRGASAVIALIGVPAEGAIHQDKPFWLVDCGIAGEHVMLRSTELGISTVWVSMLDSPKLCGLLGLPEGMECVAVFPLGYAPDGYEPKPRGRKPFEEIVWFQEYDRPYEPPVG
ncbi:MAG: nitroreductase family protein [Thermoleophilia bacterium]|nr:nitroreductase family protein [Thermoleophilia bacterium]